MKFSLGENAQNEDASNVYLSDGEILKINDRNCSASSK